MRFARKFARGFAKSFARGFAGSSGGTFDLLKKYYQFISPRKTTDIKEGIYPVHNYGTGLTDADVKSRSQVLTLDGVSGFVDTGVDFNGGETMDFTTIILPDDYFVKQTIFFTGGDIATRKGILIKIQGGANDKIRVYSADGTSAVNQTAVTQMSLLSQPVKINFSWAGDSSPMTITYNDGEASETITNIIGWVGSPYSTVRLGRGVITEYYAGLIMYSSLLNHFTYNFKEGQGTTIFDSSSNGNHGTLNSAVLEDAWANKSEYAEDSLYIYGGSQYLVCESDGTTAALADPKEENVTIPAYGEWEFIINHDDNAPKILFISNDILGYPNSDGYAFAVSGGAIGIVRMGGTSVLFLTDTGYIDDNVGYKIKIQRNETDNQYFTGSANSFKAYIQGGVYAEWTLIKPSGESLSGGVYPSNPVVDSTHTTTKFLVLDNDSGDEISHMSKDGVRYNPNNFSDGTGTYGVQNVIGIGS